MIAFVDAWLWLRRKVVWLVSWLLVMEAVAAAAVAASFVAGAVMRAHATQRCAPLTHAPLSSSSLWLPGNGPNFDMMNSSF